MKSPGAPERLLLSRGFLLALNAGAVAVIVALTIREVMDYLGILHGRIEFTAELHAFASGAMIVAHGVVLEGRVIVVRDINKKFKVASLPQQEELSEFCEVYGFFLLVLGLIIELVAVFFGLVHNPTPIFLGVQLALSVLLNAGALALLLWLSIKILRFDFSTPSESD